MKKLSYTLLAVAIVSVLTQDAFSLPSMTRRYGISCAGCHYNRINRLNQTGLNMYRMGFRTSQTDKETESIGDYLSLLGQVDAKGKKGAGVPVYESLLRAYLSGALSERFSFLIEATLAPVDAQELADMYLQYTSPGANYVTVRFGQFLPLLMVDNPVEIAADRGAPFPRERRYGAEVGFSKEDQAWVALAAVQSPDLGIGKNDLYDVVVNGQIIADDNGSSIGAYGWFGNYHDNAADPEASQGYNRFGVIGNYNLSQFLFSAGFGAGKGSTSAGGNAKTTGFYGNIDYILTDEIVPVLNVTWFDPNTDASQDEQLVVTASLFWWVTPHVNLRPQIVYTKDKAQGANFDTYRYAVRAQFIY